MRKQLLRLTIVLSSLSAIGFGAAAAHYYLRLEPTELARSGWVREMKEKEALCLTYDQPKYQRRLACDMEDNASAMVRSYNESLTEDTARIEQAASMAVGLPIGLLVMFFLGSWIATGRLKRARA